jgi:hypothetical protein
MGSSKGRAFARAAAWDAVSAINRGHRSPNSRISIAYDAKSLLLTDFLFVTGDN